MNPDYGEGKFIIIAVLPVTYLFSGSDSVSPACQIRNRIRIVRARSHRRLTVERGQKLKFYPGGLLQNTLV